MISLLLAPVKKVMLFCTKDSFKVTLSPGCKEIINRYKQDTSVK